MKYEKVSAVCEILKFRPAFIIEMGWSNAMMSWQLALYNDIMYWEKEKNDHFLSQALYKF